MTLLHLKNNMANVPGFLKSELKKLKRVKLKQKQHVQKSMIFSSLFAIKSMCL